MGEPHRSACDLLAARGRLLGPSLRLAYREPLHIVRGEGAHLLDADGRRYLDLVNNVAHVGHCHPKVVDAGCRQMARLATNTRYLDEVRLAYAERLTATLPPGLDTCFLVCSGSEANDLALRLARAATGRRGVVVVDRAYHGNLTSLVEISPYKFDGAGGDGHPPDVAVVPAPDPYRGLYRGASEAAGRRYAEHLEEAVAELERRGERPAAFFCESLLGCGGQIEPPPGYLRRAYEIARRHGAVVVADEVQVGFGRVGDAFWGFELDGAMPDIVTLGKPIGNGHPLAAVVARRDIAAAFDDGMEYFNTFGGNAVSCAVGRAVLEVIEEEALQQNAARVGSLLLEELRGLAEQHPAIGDVRGRGLFLGIELVDDREQRSPAGELAAEIVERLKMAGFLTSTDGPDANVLKIKPPLVISSGEAQRFVTALDQELAGSTAKA